MMPRYFLDGLILGILLAMLGYSIALAGKITEAARTIPHHA